jgi:hypothetical protein
MNLTDYLIGVVTCLGTMIVCTWIDLHLGRVIGMKSCLLNAGFTLFGAIFSVGLLAGMRRAAQVKENRDDEKSIHRRKRF